MKNKNSLIILLAIVGTSYAMEEDKSVKRQHDRPTQVSFQVDAVGGREDVKDADLCALLDILTINEKSQSELARVPRRSGPAIQSDAQPDAQQNVVSMVPARRIVRVSGQRNRRSKRRRIKVEAEKKDSIAKENQPEAKKDSVAGEVVDVVTDYMETLQGEESQTIVNYLNKQ